MTKQDKFFFTCCCIIVIANLVTITFNSMTTYNNYRIIQMVRERG